MSRSLRLFGTDGMRGVFGRPPLDEATVSRLGFHVAGLLGGGRGEHPAVVLGGDTRESSPLLCRWLARGLAEGGAAIRFAGVLPTPGLAYLVRHLGGAAAAVVSASHNPLPDNGIKLLDGRGLKWERTAEAALEERLLAPGARTPSPPAGEEAPRLEADLPRLYLAGLAASLPPGRPLDGLAIAVDTANGAASAYAAGLFTALGARVQAIHDRPDGTNINRDCGSTHPQVIADFTVETGSDLGVAFDGDADRAIFADERGAVRDGDAVLYLWAKALRDAGELEPAHIVATSMSNLGLERALARDGIAVVRCDVGDRVVVETMQREGILLGGEQSGHIVHLGLATTGDGLLTALQVAALVRRAGRPLSEMLAGFRRFPQVLRNVRVRERRDLSSMPGVAAAARAIEEELGGEGRLVLRYSGTEPLARIMIEGPDAATIERLAQRLARAIEEEIGEASR